MAQVTRVIQADPWTFADQLNVLAATEKIQIIEKTSSAGKFIVISDDAAPTGQTAVVISGDPQKLSDEITALSATSIDVLSATFSAAHYIVVYV